MKRTLTLRVEDEEFTVTVFRQGDAIIVERDGNRHEVHIVSEVIDHVPAKAQVAPAAPRSAPAPLPSASPQVATPSLGAGETAVRAPMSGVVKEVLVTDGATVKAGDRVVVMEAMKMDIFVDSPVSGTVSGVSVHPSATVAGGEVLLTISGGDA